jgi:hypothetical protein
MGIAVSYVCVKGKDRQAVLDALNLEDMPAGAPARRSNPSIAELPNEWIVVMCNDFDQALKPAWLQPLAAGGAELAACQIEEHVMVSRAVGYRQDGRTWSVDYNCENGGVLDVDGSLPEEFADIEAETRAEQEKEDDVDYMIEVPIRLVHALTGYRCDEAPEDGPEPTFSPLRARRPETKTSNGGGFFARLFGRR